MLCISVAKTYVYYQNIAKYAVNNIYGILFLKYGLRDMNLLWEWSDINIIYKIRYMYKLLWGGYIKWILFVKCNIFTITYGEDRNYYVIHHMWF